MKKYSLILLLFSGPDFYGIKAQTGTGNLILLTSSRPVYSRLSATDPLCVVEFHVKAKADSGTGYCFLRFFDSGSRMIYEEKQMFTGKREATGETGIYTEAPALAAAMESGVRMTAKTGSIQVDSLFIKLILPPPPYGAAIADLELLMRPFLEGDTVFREAVLLNSKNQSSACGRLFFHPDRILSVTGYSPGSRYGEGTDFTVRGDSIFATAGSAMPVVNESMFDRVKNLAWYNLQSKWILVTYTHHERSAGPFPVHARAPLPRTTKLLRSHRPVRILAYGMSITRGMNVSGFDSVPPFMPSYAELFAQTLRTRFSDSHITLFNAALPGAAIDWGARQTALYVNPLKPDLVLIDFGMNDFWRLGPAEFRSYLKRIIDSVRKPAPQTEFILIANMKFDPEYVLESDPYRAFYLSNMEGYAKVMQEFRRSGIALLNMTALSELIFSRKTPKDCLSNPLHPNDYMARWYAQGLAAMLTADDH